MVMDRVGGVASVFVRRGEVGDSLSVRSEGMLKYDPCGTEAAGKRTKGLFADPLRR